MNARIDERVATAIRSAATDAAKNAFEGFVSAAVLALGEAAVTLARDRATIGSDAVSDTLANALGTDLLGKIATDLDEQDLEVGDVRVKTHFVEFASGGEVKSPIGDVGTEHEIPFALGGAAGLEAEGALMLCASCALDDADQMKPKAWGKIKLTLRWSAEERKAGAEG